VLARERSAFETVRQEHLLPQAVLEREAGRVPVIRPEDDVGRRGQGPHEPHEVAEADAGETAAHEAPGADAVELPRALGEGQAEQIVQAERPPPVPQGAVDLETDARGGVVGGDAEGAAVPADADVGQGAGAAGHDVDALLDVGLLALFGLTVVGGVERAGDRPVVRDADGRPARVVEGGVLGVGAVVAGETPVVREGLGESGHGDALAKKSRARRIAGVDIRQGERVGGCVRG